MGCRTGTSFFVIDLDTKEGLDGPGNFLRWCTANGVDLEALLEQCPTQVTGGGGLHLCFANPPGVDLPTKTNVLRLPGDPEKNGIDVRGSGGQIVVFPSYHPDTKEQYYWSTGAAPWEKPFPPAPQALIDALLAETSKSKRKPVEIAREARPEDTPTREVFEDAIEKMTRKRTRSDKRKASDVLKLLDGQPIAEEGGGHDAFLGVTELLGRNWPFAEPVVVMEYIRPGIEARVRAGGKTSFWDVERMFKGAQERYSAEAEERESGWKGLLGRGENGAIKPTASNVLITLREHEDWQGVWGYNSRTTQPMFMRPPPLFGDKGEGARPIKESDDIKIVEWFHLEMRMEGVSSRHVREAVLHLVEQHAFDPFKDWMCAQNWDGKRRNATWLIRYMGAEDTPLIRAYGRRFLIALVARTMRPGCKVDSALIAIGEQGIGKSSAFRALMPPDRPEWFTDRLSPLTNKDALQEIHGPALIEMGELQVVKQVRENEDHKLFMTIQEDKFRKPYARDISAHPRTCVFVGTTNDYTPFRDATGARRWWTFIAGLCDVAGLSAVAPQLIAEAKHDFDQNEQWWLTPDEERIAAAAQREFYDEPAFVGPVERWLLHHPKAAPGALPAFVNTKDVLEKALNILGYADQGKHSRQLSETMVHLGYRKKRIMVDGHYFRGWYRIGATRAEMKESILATLRVDNATPGGYNIN